MIAKLDNTEKKHYRSIGHRLSPVVMIAEQGINRNILDDIDTRLENNELIKIKISVDTREEKKRIIEYICDSLHAQLVQQIGNTALLFRAAEKPNPRLSNLLRL